MSGPTLVKFPDSESPQSVKDVLEKALADNLPNVIVLSELDGEGGIYHASNDGMTVSEANWIIDAYKFHLLDRTNR